MPQLSKDKVSLARRYALCVGIGTYTELTNRNLRYAATDAEEIAKVLSDPARGDFKVTQLVKPDQTTKAMLDEMIDQMLNGADRHAEDLAVIYFSCHGDLLPSDDTFCLLPSNATLQANGIFKKTTVMSIYDLAKMLSGAKVHNIIVFLDVCHSGGAGIAFQKFNLDLSSGPNLSIIGAARQDQVAMQSSQLEHGLFTHCLLRAFEQPPSKDGWLTVSQIRSFVSDDIQWFSKEHPISIQEWSVSVNPNLPLLRNPGYPELCPLPPLWNVPFQRNPFFTGQDALLSQLANLLQSEQKTALTQPQALTGLGGIGKTQLALEYAYRHRQDYHAVLWGRADTREAFISTFVSIAHLLDLPEKDAKDQLITVEAVKKWLADRSNWLFILDNADELVMVKEFIPPAFRGHLLLTTRAQVMGGLAHKLEVETMRKETGTLLLLRRAGLLASDAPLEQASPADVKVAKELSKEMGGLPLALDQAGAYIEATECSLTDYLQLYRTHRAELLKERGGIVPDHPESVATTWSLAFQKVEQANPAAGDLLRLCAFLHPDAIPEEMITEGAEYLGPQLQATASNPLHLNKAIEALRGYSLLHRDNNTQTLIIHRLVQAVLKDKMDQITQRQWAERAVLVVNRSFPNIEFKTWERCQRCLLHAQACAELIKEHSMEFLEAGRLLTQAGWYLKERAQYAQAEPLLKQGLAIREKTLGSEHPDVAYSLNNLAILYQEQEEYKQAEPLYVRALAIRKKSLGFENRYVAQSLNNLAVFYQEQEKYKRAEPLLKQALIIYEKVLGPEDPELATWLNNMATLYHSQGKYKQAELLYQRALAIAENNLGPEHPSTKTFRENYQALVRDIEQKGKGQ